VNCICGDMEGYMARLGEDSIFGHLQDIYPNIGRVVVDWEHGSDRLEGVNELKEELGRLR
jgi:hypothetical protein